MGSVTGSAADAVATSFASNLLHEALTTVLNPVVFEARINGSDAALELRDQDRTSSLGVLVPNEAWASLCALLTFCWLLGAWLDWAAATGTDMSWQERYSFVDDLIGIGSVTALGYRGPLYLLERFRPERPW